MRKLETIMGWIFILGCMISGTKIFANDTQQTPSTQFSETERESLNELLVTSGLKAKLTDELKDDDLLWIIGLLVKDNAPGTSQEDLRPVAIEALKYIVARHRNDKDGKIPDSTADLLNKSDKVWGEEFEEQIDYIVSQASRILNESRIRELSSNPSAPQAKATPLNSLQSQLGDIYNQFSGGSFLSPSSNYLSANSESESVAQALGDSVQINYQQFQNAKNFAQNNLSNGEELVGAGTLAGDLGLSSTLSPEALLAAAPTSIEELNQQQDDQILPEPTDVAEVGANKIKEKYKVVNDKIVIDDGSNPSQLIKPSFSANPGAIASVNGQETNGQSTIQQSEETTVATTDQNPNAEHGLATASDPQSQSLVDLNPQAARTEHGTTSEPSGEPSAPNPNTEAQRLSAANNPSQVTPSAVTSPQVSQRSAAQAGATPNTRPGNQASSQPSPQLPEVPEIGDNSDAVDYRTREERIVDDANHILSAFENHQQNVAANMGATATGNPFPGPSAMQSAISLVDIASLSDNQIRHAVRQSNSRYLANAGPADVRNLMLELQQNRDNNPGTSNIPENCNDPCDRDECCPDENCRIRCKCKQRYGGEQPNADPKNLADFMGLRQNLAGEQPLESLLPLSDSLSNFSPQAFVFASIAFPSMMSRVLQSTLEQRRTPS